MVWKASGRRIVFVLFLAAAGAAGPAPLGAEEQPPPKPAQEEFVPIDQLPPGDTLPAARFLIAAYSVAWVLVAGYLFSIWQRLGQVEREIADVSRRIQQGSPAAAKPTGGDRGAR